MSSINMQGETIWNRNYKISENFEVLSKTSLITNKQKTGENLIDINKVQCKIPFLYVEKVTKINLLTDGNTTIEETMNSNFKTIKREYDHLNNLSNHPNSIKPISFSYSF